MDFIKSIPKPQIDLIRLPEVDGDGYEVRSRPPLFVGYVFRSAFNCKWAAYSTYGQAMTDCVFDTALQAALSCTTE